MQTKLTISCPCPAAAACFRPTLKKRVGASRQACRFLFVYLFMVVCVPHSFGKFCFSPHFAAFRSGLHPSWLLVAFFFPLHNFSAPESSPGGPKLCWEQPKAWAAWGAVCIGTGKDVREGGLPHPPSWFRDGQFTF